MCLIPILVKVKYFEEVQSSPYCAEFNEEFIYVYFFRHSYRFKVHLMVKSNCLHFFPTNIFVGNARGMMWDGFIG